MFGNAPRTMQYGVAGPSNYGLQASLQRTFKIYNDRAKFIFRADCQNVTNKTTFSGIGVNMNSSTFGQVTTATGNTGARDFMFSGRIRF